MSAVETSCIRLEVIDQGLLLWSVRSQPTVPHRVLLPQDSRQQQEKKKPGNWCIDGVFLREAEASCGSGLLLGQTTECFLLLLLRLFKKVAPLARGQFH